MSASQSDVEMTGAEEETVLEINGEGDNTLRIQVVGHTNEQRVARPRLTPYAPLASRRGAWMCFLPDR